MTNRTEPGPPPGEPWLGRGDLPPFTVEGDEVSVDLPEVPADAGASVIRAGMFASG